MKFRVRVGVRVRLRRKLKVFNNLIRLKNDWRKHTGIIQVLSIAVTDYANYKNLYGGK